MPEPEIEDTTQNTLNAGEPDGSDAAASAMDNFAKALNPDSGEPAAEPATPAEPATAEPAAPAEPAAEPAATTDDTGAKLDFSDLAGHGIHNKEDLDSTLAYLQDLKGQLKGVDLAKVKEQSDRLQEYEKQWAIEDELKKREDESDTETITRLTKEREDQAKTEEERVKAGRAEEETQQMLETYDNEVSNTLKADKTLDPLIKGFLDTVLPSDSEMNNFDPADPVASRLLAKNMKEALVTLKQSIIQEYVGGKRDIAPIVDTPDAVVGEGKGPQTIKEAAAIAKKKILAAFN